MVKDTSIAYYLVFECKEKAITPGRAEQVLPFSSGEFAKLSEFEKSHVFCNKVSEFMVLFYVV